MSRSVVRSIRAYLAVVSMTATVIDVGVLALMSFFSINESAFETTDFRITVIATLIVVTVLLRLLAFAAYRVALRQRRMQALSGDRSSIRAVHHTRGFSALVSLHLRFSGVTEDRHFLL